MTGLAKTEVPGFARHARFTLRCRHRQPAPACPFGAITGSDHTHSITSSARPRRGNTYSKSARGHEVCSQYHLGREFQGKIARWYSMQNSVHEISCAVRTPTRVNTITDQPASDDMFAISIRLGAAGVGLAFLENNLALAIMARLREMTNDENPLPSSRISVLQRCNNCRSILYHRS